MAENNEESSGGLSAMLKNIKLKKGETSHDASKPKTSGFMEMEHVAKYQSDVLDINVEEWYDLIKEETFLTEFVPMTLEDAKTFIEAYEETQNVDKIKESAKISDKVLAKLKPLENRIQEVIDRVRGTDPAVFAKSSCRSAKDTTLYDKKFKGIYKNLLDKHGDKSLNTKIMCLMEAAVEVLKVSSAAELIYTFCISERVYQDMTIATEHASRFQQNFIIRKWIDIKPEMEFRGFVHNGTLNALSQYNFIVYYPNLIPLKDDIVARIREFHANVIHPKLKHKFTSYVIDFAVTGDKFDKLWVIELNPFLSSTSGCLFEWSLEQRIFENGPFEFRYVDKAPAGSKALLAHSWRELVEDKNL